MGINWNGFQAKTPTNNFKATDASLDRSEYAEAIRKAQANAMGGTAAQGQDQLAGMLTAQAQGQGQSAAQQQLQAATDRTAAQAAGAIASQRGINPALAARMVLQQQAQANQQAAGQSAALRLQEQQGAQAALAQALQAQRGQDIALLGTSGGLQQGQNQVAAQNHQQTQATNASVATANQQAAMQAQQINAGVAQQNANVNSQLAVGAAGGLMGGAGVVATKLFGLSRGGEIDEAGGAVPGRARVAGDHPANDTVPALLSPGEIVLPRTVAQAPDAPDRAAEFVEAIKRMKAEAEGPQGYGRVLARNREMEQRLADLERRRTAPIRMPAMDLREPSIAMPALDMREEPIRMPAFDLAGPRSARVDALMREVGDEPEGRRALAAALVGEGSYRGTSPKLRGVRPDAPPAAPVADAYAVRRGDTLGAIARRSGVSLQALLAANPQYAENPNLIRVGERVAIPAHADDGRGTMLAATPTKRG